MNYPKENVIVIGAGNLAWNLIPNLQEVGYEVIQLISRDTKKLRKFKDTFSLSNVSTKLEQISKSGRWVFLTLPDSSIDSVANILGQLEHHDKIFLHCSGSIGLDSLLPLGENIGVFYPMQTFTQNRITPFESVPLFLEGHPTIMKDLELLANRLSPTVYKLDSEQRLRLHLGAVMACNFTNYLYRMAEEHMPQVHGLGFHIYRDLIKEHVDKVLTFGPGETQTGPAIRKDIPTLRKHLTLLNQHADHQELYAKFSQLISPDLKL